MREALTSRIPELAQRSIEIISIAREPGHRAKVAVRSCIPGINPVGICIGWAGLRIADVETRLRGERVSIIAFDPDPASYVVNALGVPALHTDIDDPRLRHIRVQVDRDHLALAIGKNGNNVRLAKLLTGWSIHICTADTQNRTS